VVYEPTASGLSKGGEHYAKSYGTPHTPMVVMTVVEKKRAPENFHC